jgi:hypothetical protein
MVGRVVTHYRAALVRDLLALGFRATDMFSPRLSFYELTCIIVASPPNSSVRYYLDGGWSREAQLIANLQEQQAGFGKLREPYERPGQVMAAASASNPFGGGLFEGAEAMDMEEMDRRLEERYANARKGSTGGGKRVLL